MRLRVLLPWRVEVDEPVAKVRGESVDGSFTLLPRHVDLVTVLRQSLLSYVDTSGLETFVAVDGGLLAKTGDEVLVSTPRAIRGPGLTELRAAIDAEFRHRGERERDAFQVLQRIADDVVVRLVELEELRHDA